MNTDNERAAPATLDKISGPFAALWVIWVLLNASMGGWRDGLRAALQGLVAWALIALVVWSVERARGQRDDR